MKRGKYAGAIPKDVALKLCAEIRNEIRGKWYLWAAWQCKGCVKWSGGDPARMYFNSRPDSRGCSLVNSRYSKLRALPS